MKNFSRLFILCGLLGLYNTFAYSSDVTKDIANKFNEKQLSQIAKYGALIRGKISRNWKVDPTMSGSSCTLAIKLAPDGLVISAEVVSGDAILCNSGRRAIFAAKTLPLPSDPEIALRFRDFDITLEAIYKE